MACGNNASQSVLLILQASELAPHQKSVSPVLSRSQLYEGSSLIPNNVTMRALSNHDLTCIASAETTKKAALRFQCRLLMYDVIMRYSRLKHLFTWYAFLVPLLNARVTQRIWRTRAAAVLHKQSAEL